MGHFPHLLIEIVVCASNGFNNMEKDPYLYSMCSQRDQTISVLDFIVMVLSKRVNEQFALAGVSSLLSSLLSELAVVALSY